MLLLLSLFVSYSRLLAGHLVLDQFWVLSGSASASWVFLQDLWLSGQLSPLLLDCLILALAFQGGLLVLGPRYCSKRLIGVFGVPQASRSDSVFRSVSISSF